MIRAAIRLQSFLFAGCCALIFPIMANAFKYLLVWRGMLHRDLLGQPVIWVVTLFWWILIMLCARARVLATAKQALEQADTNEDLFFFEDLDPSEDQGRALGLYVPWQEVTSRSGPAKRNRLSAALQDLDPRIYAWHSKVQGLIWALPAIGFLSAAWELRRAVMVGLQLSGNPSTDTRTVVVGELHSVLGLALLVICVALGTAAASHIASTALAGAEIEFAVDLRAALPVRNTYELYE